MGPRLALTAALVVYPLVGVGITTWSSRAEASPAVDGTRNLSLGNTGRASTWGSNAVLLNPSNMTFGPTFAIEPMYQVSIQSRTHGIGAVVMDSLNNSRVALGLGYLFMRGAPTIGFADTSGASKTLELSRFGHEAFLAISVAVVKNWVSLALKPKYQYASLRYRDENGVARNAHAKLNAFGLDVAATLNLAGWAAVSVIGTNVAGNNSPAFTDTRDLKLTDIDAMAGTTSHRYVPELSDYPLAVAHGASVFPLRKQTFSLNFDGSYDFSSFRFEKATRKVLGGSAEFVAGPVPLRFGANWDSRGKGKADDRVYVSGGIAYVRQPPAGGLGVDVGFGFSQQVTGPRRETVLGFNLGLRLNPDL